MQEAPPIASAANPLLKRVRAVRKGTERDAMALEGDRLIEDALASGLEPETVLVAVSRTAHAEALAARGLSVRLVADELLADVSALRTPPGALALLRVPRSRALDELPTAADALLAVACGVQDPGNLGALARTAEAAGAAGLVVVAGGCRPWNDKALRGSMGSLLRLPVFEALDPVATWDALVESGCRPVVARTRDGVALDAFDWSGRVALWLTAESGAFPPELRSRGAAADGVTIPMAGGVESLNVTAAAAVLLFAARRGGGPR